MVGDDKVSKAVNISVKPLKKDSPEKLIRRFRRKVKKAGIVNEVRHRRYYRKPSDERNERNNRIKREKAKNKNLRNKKN